MQNYYFYIYPDINGNYEVHTENCYYLPSELNRQYIGRYSSCQAAIIAAQNCLIPIKSLTDVIIVAVNATRDNNGAGFSSAFHCGVLSKHLTYNLARLVQILQCHIVLNHTPRNLIA